LKKSNCGSLKPTQKLGEKRKIVNIPQLDMELKKHYKENTKEAASSLSKVLIMHISPSTLWRYRMDMQVYKCKSRKKIAIEIEE
jgi:hypothetical protein